MKISESKFNWNQNKMKYLFMEDETKQNKKKKN